MTTFQIKLIAIITMVIDHIGAFFFPHVLVLRIIGRLAFPLFAWLIANGAYYTRSMNKYLFRIGILAIISQIPFMVANKQIDPSFWQLNVLFTLFLGLLAIQWIKGHDNIIGKVAIVAVLAGLASLLKADYGSIGVIAIVLFYRFLHDIRLTILSQVLVWILLPLASMIVHPQNSYAIAIDGFVELIGLFSLIFISLYNKKEGYNMKSLFYLLYPMQYIIIGIAMKIW